LGGGDLPHRYAADASPTPALASFSFEAVLLGIFGLGAERAKSVKGAASAVREGARAVSRSTSTSTAPTMAIACMAATRAMACRLAAARVQSVWGTKLPRNKAAPLAGLAVSLLLLVACSSAGQPAERT